MLTNLLVHILLKCMPVNAPPEYYKAEIRFQNAKIREEKILALEEMIRLLPRHHGSEKMHAGLKSRLAKLKKETAVKKGTKTLGVAKEGESQVCIMGFTNSGKSTLLAALTDAEPKISEHPYTTTKPQVGMIDYKGVKIQLVEIPATFDSQYLSIARTADLILLTVRDEAEKAGLEQLLGDNFIRIRHVFVNPFNESAGTIKEKIWISLGLIIVYTQKTNTPMALKKGATIRDFASRIHKDFIKNFRFARIYRKKRAIQAGLNYVLEDSDAVELHMK